MHSVLSYKMLARRGLRDQAAGAIAIFNRFGNRGDKMKFYGSGHKSVEAKPGVGVGVPDSPGLPTASIPHALYSTVTEASILH